MVLIHISSACQQNYIIMGNIEEPKKVIQPLHKTVTAKEIRHHKRPRCSRTEIVTTVHSSRLQCKVNFHKFGRIQAECEWEEDEPGLEEWTEPVIPLHEEQPEEKENEKGLLQDLIEAETLHGRVGVNWAGFVKTKRRSYLEDYVFVKELGKGAFGSVAKVKMKYGTLCRAVKIIRETASLREERTRQKLLAEIAIPTEMDHPNIAKLYEVFQYRGTIALVMELCEGGDLFSFIRSRRTFSESNAADLLRQILSAVYYMHKRGVCHRDLKPENMLYDNQSGLLKVTDFGTATHFKPGQKFSALVGTPYYVAPEVINGSYDEKSDVWSVGVILYVILSGAPPFAGRNQREILEKVKTQPVEFSNPIWNKRSPACKELIINMLRRDPENRFSAEQALGCPWLQQSRASPQVDPDIGKQIISNLRNFHFQNKLKAVVYTYIASQLYSNKDKEELLRVFKEIDRDGDGVIERDELVRTFSELSTNLRPEEVGRILELIDTNGSGRIDFTEFLVAASNEEQLLKKKQLESAFSYLDSDHSGYITFEEVQAFLDGTEQTSEEIRQIFLEVDDNGDGRISKNEFVALLLGKKE